MKTNRIKVIQLLLGFALTLGLMLGLSCPAMAQTETPTDPQTTPTYQEVETWQELKNAIDNSSSDHPAYIKLGTNITNTTSNPLYVSQNNNTYVKHVVYLDLAGHTLSRSLSSSDNRGYVIGVANGGQLTLEDSTGGGIITGGRTKYEPGNGCGGGVYIGELGTCSDRSTFTMKGGTIEGNTSTNGGGVFVGNYGTFNMEGGTIQNNSAGTNGGGVYVNSSGSFTMSGNTVIQNNIAYGTNRGNGGGGVYIDGNAFTMNSGTIHGNTANGSGGGVYTTDCFTMNGGTISNNDAFFGGGVSAGTITMTNGTISGNTAQNGGGVNSSNTFNLSGGTIQSNTADDYGGGVYSSGGTINMSGGTIQNNIAENNGGGVFVIHGSFTMNSGSIKTNKATGNNEREGKGGGVYITENVTFPMSGGSIETNTAGNTGIVGNGGGVFIDNGAYWSSDSYNPTFNMDGGTLSGNHATGNGGGVCNTGGTINMTAGTMQSNTATQNGGGVYVVDYVNRYGKHYSSTSNMTGGTISGNTATENGGGVYVSTGGTFNMNRAPEGAPPESGTISGNIATQNGGGVYNTGTFAMNAGTIGGAEENSGNQAVNGGGVYVSTGGTFNMNSATVEGQTVSGTISGNTATENGGGVYNTGTFAMNAGTIGNEEANKGNHAANGGGVYNGGGSFAMGSATGSSPCTISGNTADIPANGDNNSDNAENIGNGGGVYIAENSSFTLTKGTIKSNTASENGGGIYSCIDFTLGTNAVIQSNTASNGGGVYVNKGAFTVSGSTIQYNIATTNGGGVYVAESGTFTMDSTTGAIENNEATNGGGVFIAENSTFSLIKGLINGNKATNGGGIYSCIDFSIGNDALIQSNNATNGGGVYVNTGDTFNMNAGAIDGNTATNGGGVYINGGSFNMSAGAINGNTATDNGGGVYVNGGTFTLSNGTIQNNTAGTDEKRGDGGGVFVKGSFTMSGGAIDSNTATDNGGGVFIAENGTFTMDSTTTGSGTVQSNKATNGGGVYVNGGTFTLSKGTVQSNAASTTEKKGDGGGVYVNTGGTFDMSGGNLHNNTATQNGGGIYAATNIKFDGNPAITDNTVNNAANNVYLPEDVKIDVGKNLQPTQTIGVTTLKRFDIITINANYTSHDEAQAVFNSDDSEKKVYKTLKGTQARLGPKIPHTVTLVGGNHATPDGPTTQEDLTEPMQTVTYTSNSGYEFSQSSPYYKTTEGITVQRTSHTTVTVSGEPTANVQIIVPDAIEKKHANVTFKVEHGAWDDGTEGDKTVSLTCYEDETLKLAEDQIPAVGNKPDKDYKAGYKSENWDTVPSPDTVITEDTIYTYTYEEKGTQIIDTKDVPATYGDTDVKVEAKVTDPTSGGGALSYVVKDGKDIVDVNSTTGELSIKKAGTAKVTVTAAETDDYKKANADVTVTIAKKGLTVTAKPKSITYGDAPANDGVTYDGFVYDEDEKVLGGTLAYDYSYQQYGDVGSYTITPKGLTSDNYDINYQTGNLTVEKKTVGLEWGDTNFTYDGKSHAPTAKVTGTVHQDEINVTVDGAQTNAGEYTATASTLTGDKAGNYQLPQDNTKPFTIAKADSTSATVTAGDRTYDGSEKPLVNVTGEAVGGTMMYAALKSKDTEPSPDDWKPEIPKGTNAGTYYVWYKVQGDKNHNDFVPDEPLTVTIDKAEQQIDAKDVTAIYGDTGVKVEAKLIEPASGGGALSYAVKEGKDVVDINAATGDLTIKKAGTAKVTVTAAETDNYKQATKDVSVTINKKAITPTVSIEGWTYGQAANEPTVSGNEGKGAVTYTYAAKGSTEYSDKVPTGAGDYTVKATVAETENYLGGESTADFTIAKAEQQIDAKDVTATYGDTGVKVDAKVIVPASGGGALSYAVKEGNDVVDINAATGELTIKKAGTAKVTVTATETDNYRIANKVVKVTINKVDAKVTTPPTANDLTYNGQAQELVTKGEASGGTTQYAIGTQEKATGEYTDAIPTGTDVGTYYVWYKVKGDDNHNDYVTDKPVTVTIAKADLTITADSAAKEYDGKPLTKDSYKSEGLSKSDTIESIKITGSQKYVGKSDNKAEDAVIKRDQKDAGANYNITYKNGTLEVTDRTQKYEITVEANSATYTYDGQEHSVSGFKTLTFIEDGVSYTVSGLSAEATRTDVGETPVEVKGRAVVKDAAGEDVSAQFNVKTKDGKLTITKPFAEVIKAPKAKDLTYNAQAQELVTAGEATGGTMEYALGADDKTAPTESWGTIIPTGKDAGTYYAWYKVKGDANHEDSELECLAVTILKKSMSVTADAKSKKYGEVDPELTYTSEGLIESDTLQGALTRQSGETVGTYEIRQGTLTAGDNYTMTYNPAVLTIVQSDPDVKLAPVANSLTYNGQARELVTPGEPLGGTMEYALGTDDKTAPTEGWGTAVPTGTNAGAYYVWYRVTGDASHKDVPPKPITVTILPKALSVTADAKNKKIGEADPELTYTQEGLVEGDTIQGALTRQAGETAGTYEIQQGTLTAGDNYIMAYTPAALTITREPGQITSEIIIGDNLPNMTVSGFDDAVAKKLCTPEEIKRVEEGENIHITLKITGLDSPSAEDKALCEDAAARIGQNAKIGMYMDISIYKKVGNDEPQKVTDTNGNMITVTFDIPAELKAPANTQRAFYIIRTHDGKAECISATDQGDRVSFQTDKFSTYALAYQDTNNPNPVNPVNPGSHSGTGNRTNTAAKTGVEGNDNTRVALIIAGLALIIGVAAFAVRRKQKQQ